MHQPAAQDRQVRVAITGEGLALTLGVDLFPGVSTTLSKQLAGPQAQVYVSRVSTGIARLLLANLDEALRPPTQAQVARAAQLAVAHRVSLSHEVLMDRTALQDFVDTLVPPPR